MPQLRSQPVKLSGIQKSPLWASFHMYLINLSQKTEHSRPRCAGAISPGLHDEPTGASGKTASAKCTSCMCNNYVQTVSRGKGKPGSAGVMTGTLS